MARWTIQFDAAVTVNVEADTLEQAVAATAKTLVAVGLAEIPAELVDCSIVKKLVVNKHEQAEDKPEDQEQ